MQKYVSEFRAEVIKRFGTVRRFAQAMEWSARKASYICTGRQIMTIEEAQKCAEVFDVTNESDFLRIFFPMLSIKWTNRKGA